MLISTPILAISLEDDLFGTHDAARYTAEHIPDSKFVSYPDGGHIWVGRHTQVIEEIATFLQPPKADKLRHFNPTDRTLNPLIPPPTANSR